MKLAASALLLTFMTAVTAGFLVYHFVSNLTERMKTAFPTQPLQLEDANVNETCITLYVRSFSSVNVRIVEAYVDNRPWDLAGNIEISPGTVGVIHLYGAYADGETYSVKLVPSFGSPSTFNVKYG